ncbi:hypothetical protein [Blastochloris tepida]|uniref:Ribbon-helix-helix protein CopG domain-containing protein n=1 Tax=Blastochloris tepida TaxID=2233851 RepID=A0A348G464_9HYPH|nr:hypothetical protein [Blastochloris tepida]BBF94347.1 hypothetical protein BLTE_30320 [Blastochloris tepida]
MTEKAKSGAPKKDEKAPTRAEPRVPGKRQFLAYLDPATVKAVKIAAIERETSASAIAEIALREWLERNVK